MLKEIKRVTDIITNVDLFNEIVLKVKESGNWPETLIEYVSANDYDLSLIHIYLNVWDGTTNKLSCMIVLYLNCHLLRWQFF